MYQALYRKWRPKVFSEVVGQGHITDTLRRQVAEGHTAHAYLFTGTRGTGKTTCARILAKAVNCLSPVDGEPCGRCEACRAVDAGTTLDITELDAASNNGVDQVRALREEAVYTPAVLKKAGVYHRRGAYALHPGLQRAAEDPGGAAGASDVHSGYHGAAQGPGHHPLPVPALLLQAHPAP